MKTPGQYSEFNYTTQHWEYKQRPEPKEDTVARHAREHEVIKENVNLFKHLNRKTAPLIFGIGDTTYTCYGISHNQGRYIVDVSDQMLIPEDDSKVRFILDKALDLLEIHYILDTSRNDPRCRACKGIDRETKETDKGQTTYCRNCGVEQYNEI